MMNIILKFIGFALAMILSCGGINAQDIHFSQFYNSPLTLNPALTGKVYGIFRVGFNYRNQWPGIVSGRATYVTPSLSFDIPVRFKSKDILGAGFYILNDRSSGGKLTHATIMLSTAYHKAMGKDKNHVLSLGVQFGLVSKKLDLANIRLGDQVNLSTDISADQLNGKSRYFDFNTGIHWNSQFTEKVNVYFGYALMHAFEADESFTITGFNVPRRNVYNAGLDLGVGKKIFLLPSFIFMKQTNVSETNLGLGLDIKINNESIFNLGGYYRLKDAVIPYVGFSVKGFKLGMSYDMTTSQIQNSGGGIEFSLMYIGKYIPVPDVTPSLYCPRF